MYQDFLKLNAQEKRAYFAGFRMAMQIMANANSADYAAILEYRSEDEIVYLCNREEANQQRKARKVARLTVERYEVDLAQFRGLFLNRARVDARGNDIDLNGNPCERQPYPCYYLDSAGFRITAEAFAQLTLRGQSSCEKVLKIELRDNDDVRSINVVRDRAIVDALITKILPHEPMEILELYRQALHDHSNTAIQLYRERFELIFQANTPCPVNYPMKNLDIEAWFSHDGTQSQKITSSSR